jgi:serine protease Do
LNFIRHSVLLIFLVFFTSCVSYFDTEPSNLSEINLEQIRSLIDEGKLAEAYSKSSFNKEFEFLLPEISSQIQERLNSALEQDDFDLALALSSSSVFADDQSYISVRIQLASSLFEEKKYAASMAIWYSLKNSVSQELLQQWAARFLKTGHPSFAQVLDESFVESDKNEDRTELLQRLLDSTITVSVDRGIRIENGRGIPDRVIGSGFFIDKSGYIITNYHVIESEVDPKYEGFSRISILLDEDRKIPARVIGWDPDSDLALLKAEYIPNHFINLFPWYEPQLGEQLYAVGSPGGLQKTVTSGIVSARERDILPYLPILQVDVPINSGNSGGPLLTMSGQAAGVVFAGIEYFEGVNFAIPVRILIDVLPDLYKGGRVRHPWLGLSLKFEDDQAVVWYALPGSPVYDLGLREGVEILSINGRVMDSKNSFQRVMRTLRPGSLAEIEIPGGEIVYTYIEERPKTPVEALRRMDVSIQSLRPLFGMSVESSGSNFTGRLYTVKEVLRGSAADEAGISVDDPFNILGFDYDPDFEVVWINIRIRKRLAGNLDTNLQLAIPSYAVEIY